MIKINLLPEELRVRKKQALAFPALPVMPIVIGVVGFLIALQLILAVLVHVKKAVFNSLNGKYSSISTSHVQAAALENDLKDLSYKVDTVEKLSISRFKMSKKLNDLSNLTVPGVWLRSIDIRKGESPSEPGVLREALIIEGSSTVSGEKEDGSIGRFVNSLKENAPFSEDFSEIELTKVERKKIRSTEVMDFIVICTFKKGRGL
jgi:Tfp pilus assembly protein PilN